MSSKPERTGVEWTTHEEELIVRIKDETGLSWPELHRAYAHLFNHRSESALYQKYRSRKELQTQAKKQPRSGSQHTRGSDQGILEARPVEENEGNGSLQAGSQGQFMIFSLSPDQPYPLLNPQGPEQQYTPCIPPQSGEQLGTGRDEGILRTSTPSFSAGIQVASIQAPTPISPSPRTDIAGPSSPELRSSYPDIDPPCRRRQVDQDEERDSHAIPNHREDNELDVGRSLVACNAVPANPPSPFRDQPLTVTSQAVSAPLLTPNNYLDQAISLIHRHHQDASLKEDTLREEMAQLRSELHYQAQRITTVQESESAQLLAMEDRIDHMLKQGLDNFLQRALNVAGRRLLREDNSTCS
ncbi:hypothetical protein BDV18DRAFT_155932 [Aspergillus unguis]